MFINNHLNVFRAKAQIFIIMKNIIAFLMCMVMTTNVTFAQKRFEPSVKVSYEIPLDKNQSFGADFNAGYRLSEIAKIGVGIGAYWCEHIYDDGYSTTLHKQYDEYKEAAMYIPVYLNGKFNFSKQGISPYFSMDLGYSLFVGFSDYVDNHKLGLFFRPAFGIDFPTSNGKIFTEIGYKYQMRDWDYIENPNYSQITVSVGYSF